MVQPTSFQRSQLSKKRWQKPNANRKRPNVKNICPSNPRLRPRKNALLDALVFGHFRVDPNVWSWYEWSTQISHRREELVVNLTKTLHPRSDLILHAKPPGWLRTVAPGLIASGSYSGPHLHAIHEQNSADSIVYALRALGQYHGRALHLSPTESVESCYTRLWADRHAPEYTRTDPGL